MLWIPHISLAASQSDIGGKESDFVSYNPPAVTEIQSISSKVKEAKDQICRWGNSLHFQWDKCNSLFSTNTGPAISG